MIEDRVYLKLRSIKGSRSFGKVIDSLFEESHSARKARLKKYAGILSRTEADELAETAREIRRNLKART